MRSLLGRLVLTISHLVLRCQKSFHSQQWLRRGEAIFPANLFDPRNGLDVVHTTESFTETSLFLWLGFIQSPRYACEDDFCEKSVKHTQQVYWAIVSKIFFVTILVR
ncbi:hypothetical protein Y032_0130g1531 [Ancylostoma ceylanicum]|uniref:Secreted protein n=1 Tax=Ancylostoma ceylanicum TaxID=53326 RepID=A0A016T6I8_9BILA|nr:hypothetical protein Y032_0130g1531 [Ancylostoma ceylanicum]